jgi:PAS domain S-box-containing protein
MTPFSIRHTIVIGYIIALGIICFFTFYTYLNMQEGEAENRHLNETLQSLRTVERVFDDMQNIETGQWGYVISGDKSFLKTYLSGLSQLNKDSFELLNMRETDPARKKDIKQLLVLFHDKIKFAESTVKVRDESGKEAAEKKVQSNEGRLLMDNIGDLIRNIENEDRVKLKRYNDHREVIAKQTAKLFFLLASLFILFLLSFFFLTRRDLRRRLHTELNSQVNAKTIAFKDILDRISDGFLALDKDWKYVYINSKASEIIGKKQEDLVGKSVWAEYPVDIDNEFYIAYHRAMDNQEYVFLEEYYPGFDKWFENHIYPSPDGLSVHFRDITEKKKTESKLEQAIEKFNIVAKATNDVLWEADLVNETLWWNDNFYEKFGYKKKENEKGYSDKSWESYLHPDDKERVLLEVNAVIGDSNQMNWTDEYRFAKADGSYLNIFDRCYIMRDADGKAIRMIGSMADVTSLFETKKELQRTEEQYSALVNTIDGIVWEADARTFQFSFVSRQAERLLGYPAELWTSPDFWVRHIHQDDRDWVVSYCVQCTREKRSHEFEYRMIAADGRIVWLRDIIAVVEEKDKPVLLRGLMVDITSSKKAEEEIQKSHERFNLVASATNDMLWDWDYNTNVMWWNENFYNQLGYLKEQTKPGIESWFEGLHPDDKDAAIEGLHEAISQRKEYWSAEYRFLKAGGEVVDIYDRAYILYDVAQQPSRMIGSMLDITQRKKASEAIRESEEKYRTLVEQASDGIFIADKNGRFIVVNSIGIKMSQYPEEELMNMTIYDLTGAEDLQHNPFHFSEMTAEKGARAERKMRKKDGSFIDIEVNAKFLSDGRFLAFIRDITETKKAVKEVIKAKELADTIIDSLPGIFYFCDETGKFIRWNKQFETVTGYSAQEIETMHPTDFFEGEEKEYISKQIEAVFTQGINDAEAFFTAKSGEKSPYYFKAALIKYEGKPCLLGTGIDITERMKAEQKLQESFLEIRQLTEYIQNIREEERSHIAREIHDELGQQLTVLKMDVAWLNTKIGHIEEPIRQKLKSLTEMLDGTVKTVRRISSELRPSLLDDLGLIAAIDWHLKEFEKRSGVKTEFEEPEHDLLIPDTVKTGLFRIFQESLANVARHAGSNKVKVSLQQKNEHFVLSIADDGKGFEKQMTKHKRTLGILGMKERTTMMGGTYEINSEPGKGTLVVVSIPVS